VKSDGQKGDSADAEIHDVLHHDVDGIFGPCEAGFQHGEPGLHDEYEKGGDAGPEDIAAVLQDLDIRQVAQDGDLFGHPVYIDG
jgi:hypothetical protein